MKLTWGEQYWPSQSKTVSRHSLEADVSCDVLVVGAGISGALLADELVRAGLDVVAIDKRSPGCGSTGASTALLLYELDTPLHKLSAMVGKEAAVRAYRLGSEAIGRIEQLVTELGYSCGFERKQSLYLAREASDMEALSAECDARRSAGFDVTLLSKADIKARFGFSRPGAILSSLAAQIDPFQLNQRLLERAIKNGLRLFTGAELTGYEPVQDGVMARTVSSRTIRARHLIYATGYEAANLIGANLSHAQISYVIVSEPHGSTNPQQLPLIWEMARPYLYIRTTTDGRFLIGGEDDLDLTHLNDMNRVRNKARTLKARFHQFFPQINFDIAAAWAGVFESSPDGLPYIGPHPRFPHALFALGYGGNGITFSVIAADLLRDRILGRDNYDANIFRFDRRRV